MYELIFDTKAIEYLKKLPKEIRKRIFNKLLKTKENPLRFFERLVERKDHKLRIGDYRIIADIDNKIKRIQITLIGNRKNIYDKV